MIKIKNVQMIVVGDWDDLVETTYGKPYSFQQQDGCQERGTHHFTVPDGGDDFENDALPEDDETTQMGVSFAAWLARDPKEWNGSESGRRWVNMFWERNFYPNMQMIANDLHEKGASASW